MRLKENLLWVDCIAGACVGIFVLLLIEWLAALYQLPREFVLFLGVANLAYGSFSWSLATRKNKPYDQFVMLVVANLSWGALCVYWLFYYWSVASPFGIAQLLLEALFVGGLGAAEWINRKSLNIRGLER